jgi:hypothetical protein
VIAGASAAAFGVTVAGIEAGSAAADPSNSLGFSVQLASQWPWGATVDAGAPYYLSPGTGQTRSSAISVTGSILGPPLLVIPLLVNVDVGSPAVIMPPFVALVIATGSGLAVDTVQISIPFDKTDKANGHVFTKEWLGVFPVVAGHGSIQIQGTIPAAAAPSPSAAAASAAAPSAASAQSPGSTLTLTFDSSTAPPASALSTDNQNKLVGSIASQSLGGFAVTDLFSLVNSATASAKAKLLEIQSRRSAISIGDMFEMQMLMNNLDQLSESSTAVMSSVNDAIQSMARNVKG